MLAREFHGSHRCVWLKHARKDLANRPRDVRARQAALHSRRGMLLMRHVAVLGTGKMGAGMARSLLRSGLDVSVWNRSPGRAAALAAAGAQVAGTVAEAVAGADAVVTMLWDGSSVAEVMTEALPAASDGILWAQTSTVSLPDAGDRLPALAGKRGARYIDAPVLGTRQPAEDGKLVVLAAAPEPLRDPVTPLFDAIAARTV